MTLSHYTSISIGLVKLRNEASTNTSFFISFILRDDRVHSSSSYPLILSYFNIIANMGLTDPLIFQSNVVILHYCAAQSNYLTSRR
nr:MAG TPA: hypothetical protein [Caudoviricetes sp.]